MIISAFIFTLRWLKGLSSQQYFYEYVDFDISSRPRHVCPYAVVSYYFKSKEALTVAPKPLPPLRYLNALLYSWCCDSQNSSFY